MPSRYGVRNARLSESGIVRELTFSGNPRSVALTQTTSILSSTRVGRRDNTSGPYRSPAFLQAMLDLKDFCRTATSMAVSTVHADAVPMKELEHSKISAENIG